MLTKKRRATPVVVPLRDGMERAGFSPEAAKQQDEFWARFGITGVRVGKRTLKVGGGKK